MTEEEKAAFEAANRKNAADFYKKYNPSLTEDDIDSHMSGIDFNKPVKVVGVPPEGVGEKGNQLFQYTKTRTDGMVLRGDYYTNDINAVPNDLGLSEKYNAMNDTWKRTEIVKTHVQEQITFDNPVEALKSTARSIVDDWSLVNSQGKVTLIPTDGGAMQFYIPKIQLIKK